MDLVAASDIVTLLAVYNTKLPPLAKLTEEDRHYILERNQRAF